MTNMKPANEKLKDRSLRILMAETHLEEPAAERLMSDAGGDLRVALVMNAAHLDSDTARETLEKNEWVVERAVARLGSAD